jgi:hypothetical protein
VLAGTGLSLSESPRADTERRIIRPCKLEKELVHGYTFRERSSAPQAWRELGGSTPGN